MAAGLEGVLILPLAWTLPLSELPGLRELGAREWRLQQAGKGALGKTEQVERELGRGSL